MKKSEKLALDGGPPVRKELLPYGRQSLREEDIEAVVEVLRSSWLTTGPKVDEFETALRDVTKAKEAVVLANGTAALHAMIAALELGPEDEVIVPTISFAATANCAVYQGAKPVFADVCPKTLLLRTEDVAPLITKRTKAVIAVDYGGQPCNYPSLKKLLTPKGITLLSDACHSIGGAWRKKPVGNLAKMSAFSFHPVKHIATGEGGAVTTNDKELAQKLRVFRNHGITTNHRQRATTGSWFYEMVSLGYNYRLSDIHCALGVTQLQRLEKIVKKRQGLAKRYDRAFAKMSQVTPLHCNEEATHAYHLYVVLLDIDSLAVDKNKLFAALRAEGIGVNVHYVPIHLHPFYREKFGTKVGMCPNAELAYEKMFTLPLFHSMKDSDVDDVVQAFVKILRAYSK